MKVAVSHLLLVNPDKAPKFPQVRHRYLYTNRGYPPLDWAMDSL